MKYKFPYNYLFKLNIMILWNKQAEALKKISFGKYMSGKGKITLKYTTRVKNNKRRHMPPFFTLLDFQDTYHNRFSYTFLLY